MSKFGQWISAAKEPPPQNKLVAVMVVIGHSPRGAGVAGYTVAKLVGASWVYPMHAPPLEPPLAWTPLPEDTY